MTYHRICEKSNTTGATNGAGTAYPCESPGFASGFCGFRVAQSLVFCVVFVDYCFFFPFPFGHCIVCPSNISSDCQTFATSIPFYYRRHTPICLVFIKQYIPCIVIDDSIIFPLVRRLIFLSQTYFPCFLELKRFSFQNELRAN